MVKDYYLVLGVQADADLAVIKSAYRRLAKKYHPDLNSSHDAHERMKALTEAYGVLGDAGKRALYDRRRFRHAQENETYTDTYTKPPPRKTRKATYEGVRISESQVADAIRLSRINLILTSSLLQRRFGLDYDHAAKLFLILIRRGLVDEDGRWTEKARKAASAKGPARARASENKKHATPPPPSESKPNPRAAEFRINESLMSRALQIARTNYMLSIGVLKSRLGLDQSKAARLYALLGKRGFIDENGVWTDEARKRARSKPAAPESKGITGVPDKSERESGPSAKPHRQEIRVSEELVSNAAGLAARTHTLTIAYLQRRFDLNYVRAARLFGILIERGFIERSGKWTEPHSERNEQADAQHRAAR